MPQFVTLTIRPTESEAQTLASVLEINGIPCLLNGSRPARFTGHLPSGVTRAPDSPGGTELQVDAENLLVARTLLDLDRIEARDRLLSTRPQKRSVSLGWKLIWCVVPVAGVVLWPITPEVRLPYLLIVALIAFWFAARPPRNE